MDNILHWADYLVFGVTLLFSVSIGIFYAVMERKTSGSKTEEFLLAGRKMSVLPVSVSIFVSWLSAISFLGRAPDICVILKKYIYDTNAILSKVVGLQINKPSRKRAYRQRCHVGVKKNHLVINTFDEVI